MQVRTVSKRPTAAREEGAVAIVVALSITAMLIVAAMVLDFGLVRVDRQIDKSAADAATLAGASALATGDDGISRPFSGVCAAIRYLQLNNDRFSAVSDTSGTWTTGADVSTADGCTDPTLLDQACVPGDKTTWAKFSWTGTWDGEPIQVLIQSGYQLAGSGWAEESLPALASDQSDDAQGCNQLAVIVTQNRKPGLGSLATSSDLVSTIRSVGRVEPGPGHDAPAMLLLDRHGCQVLSSTSAGSGAFIHVLGSQSSSGNTQPGSIHADTDASNCSSSSHPYIFYGSNQDTIVAYGAPLPDGTTPDPNKPGAISSYAGYLGVGASTVIDSGSNVYSTDALSAATAGSSTKLAPIGRKLVTRSVVDDRYLGLGASPTGVTEAVTDAQSAIFGKPSSYFTAANGWSVIPDCAATSADISALTTPNVYVNCTANSGYTGTLPIPGSTIVFAGSVKPPNSAGQSVSLPQATHVYIFGAPTKDAISLGTGGVFSMHTTGPAGSNLSGGQCTTTADVDHADNKAIMFIKAGDIKGTGGLLQLCRTTVIMMGGQSNGCLPTTSGTAPTTTPCAGGTGDGQISLSGGSGVDWTAPNSMLKTTDASGRPTADAIAAWHDPNGPEDLALWSESAGLQSNPTFSISGSGALHTVGVFMVPNAAPFTVGGNSAQDLTNAQYIASDIALNGGAQLTMKVDPDAAVTLPGLPPVGLVR